MMSEAPYLFNEDKKIFISYDDETSVAEKCKYVKKHHLAGAMFWEYFSDRKISSQSHRRKFSTRQVSS